MTVHQTCLLFIALHFFCLVEAQDSTTSSQLVSVKYLDKTTSTADHLEDKLDKKSERALRQLHMQEDKMKSKLARKDSTKAASIFGDVKNRYSSLEQKLQSGALSGNYISSLDTIATSLKFLQENPQLLSQAKESQQKLKTALDKINGLQGKFQKAEEIKKFLRERKEYLKQQLNQMGFAKELRKLNKQVYYYSEQLNEYKAILKDTKKAERKAIDLLSKTKLFKDFMRKNSQLASLFRLPGNPDDPVSQASLAGLQTRMQVNNLIQQTIGSNANAQARFQQNLQQAQSQLNDLKTKITKLGRTSSDTEMPEGFKPNNQKTKNFLRRLELGTNIQSQKANGYFPTTSDLGISVGYKLNDKSIIGLGASYKIGWGKDIRHVNITHQGVGVRSFVDYKVKGSLWLSGGYEMNYRSEFNSIDVFKEVNAWQQSGLVGVTKVISLRTKFFKKTKLQLLWDVLSYKQTPRTQPIVFRIGYNIK